MDSNKGGRPRQTPATQVNITMSVELKNRLDKEAAELGLTISELVRLRVFGFTDTRIEQFSVGWANGKPLAGSEFLITAYNPDGTIFYDPKYAPYPKDEGELNKRARIEYLLVSEKVQSWLNFLEKSKKKTEPTE
jgi:hypothetical protein